MDHLKHYLYIDILIMFFNNNVYSKEINKLKKLCRQKTQPHENHIEIINKKYNDMIRNIYDIELRTFFDFDINQNMYNMYNYNMYNDYIELLDDYIDMNELQYNAPDVDEMEKLIKE